MSRERNCLANEINLEFKWSIGRKPHGCIRGEGLGEEILTDATYMRHFTRGVPDGRGGHDAKGRGGNRRLGRDSVFYLNDVKGEPPFGVGSGRGP